MNPQFSLFDLLLLIGIVQGIVTGVLLWNSKKNTKSNKFLALALFAFCFLCTKTLLRTLHLWDTTIFRYFPNSIELALAPLIYFYTRSLVDPKFYFKKKYWLHFIPFILSQTYSFVLYFLVLKTNDFGQKDAIARNLYFDNIKQLDEFLLLISLALYLFFGHRTLLHYKKWLDNTISDGTFPDFNWLSNILRLSLTIGLFLVLNHSLDIFFMLKETTIIHWNLLILFIAFLIYYLGLKGYLLPNYTFEKPEGPLPQNTISRISQKECLEIVARLEKAMTVDKVFLNPTLTSYELSNMLAISQNRLSSAINRHYKINFRDFINSYRLLEVKSKLNDSNYQNMSILGIALECGFNSEASFYRIFKKNVGMSPSGYIKEQNRT